MYKFEYNKCKEGDLLYLITMNDLNTNLCKFKKNQKILTKVVSKSDYLMSLIDRRGMRHTFLSKWFEDTEDEFHGHPTLFNPDGIVVKFKKVDKKELPMALRIKNYLNDF